MIRNSFYAAMLLASLMTVQDVVGAQAPDTPAPTISASNDIAQRAKNNAIILLDVRSAEEYGQGHIPGAINIPFDTIESHLPALNSHGDKPIVVYCRSGRRANIAINTLHKHNLKNVMHLEGDMLGWSEAGFEIERM